MELIKILESIGLTKNESKIYIANLELGVTAVANISRISGIKRTTLYSILEKMEERGILEKYIKNNTTFYEAIDPDKLIGNFQNNIKSLKDKLPELRALNNKYSNKPKVSFYSGAENVAELYRIEAQDFPDIVKIFSSNSNRNKGKLDKLRKLRNDIFRDNKKYKNHAKKKIILNREASDSEKKWGKWNSKTINKEDLNLDVSIKVYGNKTHFISMKNDLTGIVIENEDIAKTMNSIFEYIWKINNNNNNKMN